MVSRRTARHDQGDKGAVYQRAGVSEFFYAVRAMKQASAVGAR